MSETTNSLTVTTPSDLEIVATRVVNAPRHLVFDAFTNPEHIPNWMLGPEGWTMPVCEIDLRPGGKWRMVWRMGDESEMEMTGRYLEIDPPERVVNTENWGGDWPEMQTSLLLTEQEEGKTTIIQRMHFPSKEARDKALETGMTEGMEQTYIRLDAHLQNVAA